MRNTKIELGLDVRNQHLSKFMIKLKRSGYNRKFRLEVINSAITAFECMVEEDKKGIKPLFRDKDWKSEERRYKKQNSNRNWYRENENSKFKTVLIVPPTPGSGLLKELKMREEQLNKFNDERIKCIEASGVKIEELMTQKNPFKKEKCSEKQCALCKNIDANEEI